MLLQRLLSAELSPSWQFELASLEEACGHNSLLLTMIWHSEVPSIGGAGGSIGGGGGGGRDGEEGESYSGVALGVGVGVGVCCGGVRGGGDGGDRMGDVIGGVELGAGGVELGAWLDEFEAHTMPAHSVRSAARME